MIARAVRYVLLLALISTPLVTHAQEGISQKQQEKILAKKAKEDKKAKVRKEKEDHERHLSLQDKATRKRIKQHARRADNHGPGRHRDSFFVRIFGHKH